MEPRINKPQKLCLTTTCLNRLPRVSRLLILGQIQLMI